MSDYGYHGNLNEHLLKISFARPCTCTCTCISLFTLNELHWIVKFNQTSATRCDGRGSSSKNSSIQICHSNLSGSRVEGEHTVLVAAHQEDGRHVARECVQPTHVEAGRAEDLLRDGHRPAKRRGSHNWVTCVAYETWELTARRARRRSNISWAILAFANVAASTRNTSNKEAACIRATMVTSRPPHFVAHLEDLGFWHRVVATGFL